MLTNLIGRKKYTSVATMNSWNIEEIMIINALTLFSGRLVMLLLSPLFLLRWKFNVCLRIEHVFFSHLFILLFALCRKLCVIQWQFTNSPICQASTFPPMFPFIYLFSFLFFINYLGPVCVRLFYGQDNWRHERRGLFGLGGIAEKKKRTTSPRNGQGYGHCSYARCHRALFVLAAS